MAMVKCTEINDILYMNYKTLDCDYDYYTYLKNDPLYIGFALEKSDEQYFIANKYVIKRQLNRPTIQFAKHSPSTSLLYDSLIRDNTVLVFSNAILTTNMTKTRATTFFRDGIDLTKLIESGKIENSIDRFYFYIKSTSHNRKVNFDVLVFTDHNFRTTIHKKREGNSEEIKNYEKESNYRIDSILLKGDEPNYTIYELSNRHATIRQYKLGRNENSKMTYHNLLNCFAPLCEGGRAKGLITLADKHLFFFLEDRYLKVDETDIFKNGKLLNQIKIF